LLVLFKPKNNRMFLTKETSVYWKISTVIGILAFGAMANCAEEPPLDGYTVGNLRNGESGVQETTTQIAARERLQSEKPRAHRIHPLRRLPASTAGQTMAAQNLTSPGIASDSIRSPLISQTLGVNFTGATLADASGFPPDSMGAVGRFQFIVAINGRIRSFNKTNGVADGVLNIGTDTFFNSVMTPPANNNFTSDPHIRYDRLSGRWFIVIIDVPGQLGQQINRVMIAVSDSGVITGSTVWTFFQFTGDGSNFADFPTLGIDANALYIGVNLFSTSSGSFVNTTAFVVRKSSVLASGPIVVTAFPNLISGHGPFNQSGPFTPQGIDNYDPAATEGYFIGVDISSLSKLQVRRVSNPGGTPSLSGNVTINVSQFSNPITVQYLGNTGGSNGELDGGDRRLLAAHFRNGQLWTAHNIGVDNTGSAAGTITRDAVRWYQLTGIPTGQTPSVVQFGNVFQASSANSTDQRSYWMGTIMVSGQGHAAMGFSIAGATNHINAATTGRLVSDSANTMSTPVLPYTASSTSYNPPGDPGSSNGRRWGDYSYTCLDPSDDMTMWTIQEFCNTTDSYAVQVVRLLAPLPALPANCTPSTVTQGIANVSVVINGSSANGTGFFDPGTNFQNHISASVNGGGVTINSVTYNTPTNLTILLTVATNAAIGTRTITVTNPDGQSATSASGILTIVGTTNHSPILAAISNQTITAGMTLTITNAAGDPDSPPQVLTFSLGTGAATDASINATNGVFSWTPTQGQAGTNGFSVVVTDNGSPSLSATQSFAVTVLASNNPPVLAAISNQTITAGMTLTITSAASDPDSPPQMLTFSLGAGAATNASINATNGVFSWTPTQAQAGTNAFSVIVTDNGSPPLSATQSFSVTVLASNNPPVLAAISNQTITAGMTLTITNAASDPDSPPQLLTFSLETESATNATINATNGILSWTPTQTQTGTNAFSVIVADNGIPSLSATQSFSVVVLASNNPPVLSPISDQTIYALTTLTFTNSATDPDSGQILTFSLDSGAPAGASIGLTNGLFVWTPTDLQAGTTNITVRVTDNGSPNLSDLKTFMVTVLARPVFQTITVTNNVVTLIWSANAGTTYRVQFKTNLTDTAWTDLIPDVAATQPTASTTDSMSTNSSGFYRILVLP
jgi:hypothetical protein